VLSFNLLGQKSEKQLITIQTTAECNECKERIENKLNYTKGISFSELDVPTKVCTVKFSPDKISKEEILKMISDLGYDADDVKANPTAYEALPTCCKIGGGDHE
jgi:copper chaperone CopZ